MNNLTSCLDRQFKNISLVGSPLWLLFILIGLLFFSKYGIIFVINEKVMEKLERYKYGK